MLCSLISIRVQGCISIIDSVVGAEVREGVNPPELYFRWHTFAPSPYLAKPY